MKMIVAIIRPQQLPAVKQALFDAQVYKLTVSIALGGGERDKHHETFRGVGREVTLINKVRLEIAVNEELVERTIAAIVKGAHTGQVGDGKIFVLDLHECVAIDDGARGEPAV